jgi:hypothetical protein
LAIADPLPPPAYKFFAVNGVRDIRNMPIRRVCAKRVQLFQQDFEFAVCDASLVTFGCQLG